MTLTEQVKILNDKIKASKAQFDLDREAAKISALSSGELEKYEYLTGEDLGYKPDVIQKAKFEYSPLGKVFNKALDESDKKEGLLKRLKNIEGKNEQQLDAIRDQGENQLDAIKNYVAKKESFKELEFLDEKQQEREKLSVELRQISKELEEEKEKGNLLCVHINGEPYDFNKFPLLEQLYHDIISGKE